MAFVVLLRTKDALAEEAAHLWFLGTVVDSFWLGDFTMAPATDFIRGSKADLDAG